VARAHVTLETKVRRGDRHEEFHLTEGQMIGPSSRGPVERWPRRYREVKRVLWWVALATVAVAGVEVVSYAALYASRPLLIEPIRRTDEIFRDQTERIRALLAAPSGGRLLAFDSTLGWRYRASYTDAHNTTNGQGVRAARLYTPTPRACTVRVAAFGDSFIYGNEVDDQDAWSAAAERMFPALEILNYGVGGYGLDQAYLRYVAEGAALSPHVVVIGFVPDDLGRLVNVYRRFLSIREVPLVKPRYVLGANGELELVPTPIRRLSAYEKYVRWPREIIELGKHDAWYEAAIYENPGYDVSATDRLLSNLWIRLKRRYIGPDRLFRGGVFSASSTAFAIQLAIFERFTEAVTARGAVPLVVMFPDRDALAAVKRGRLAAYAPLVRHLQAEGLPSLDLADAFLAPAVPFQPEKWFMPGGHYSPAGNRVVAAWLGKELLARFERCRPHVVRSSASVNADLNCTLMPIEIAHSGGRPAQRERVRPPAGSAGGHGGTAVWPGRSPSASRGLGAHASGSCCPGC
jgi:hypothetical protein